MLNAALTEASSQGAARTPVSHDFQEPSEPPDGADRVGASGGSPQSGSASSASSAGSTDSADQRIDPRNVARIFTGGDGREWTVRELPPPVYDRRRGPSLVFSADDVWRRVRNYPDDWTELSDAELYEISLGV
jgi:hypothetical protein